MEKQTAIADTYKLMVYIPMEMAETLKRIAFERSIGQKGMLSLAATVRELLGERLDQLPTGDGTRKAKAKKRENHACVSDVAREISSGSPSSPSARRYRHAA